MIWYVAYFMIEYIQLFSYYMYISTVQLFLYQAITELPSQIYIYIFISYHYYTYNMSVLCCVFPPISGVCDVGVYM